MNLCDVNVFVYAHRADASPDHEAYARWVIEMATGEDYFGLSEAVLAGFVRVVSNGRVFRTPTPITEALAFCEALRERPTARILRPGSANWRIYADLCRDTPATGKLSADAWHAALAIEWNCAWYSTDADFARFRGLDWRHPLQ